MLALPLQGFAAARMMLPHGQASAGEALKHCQAGKTAGKSCCDPHGNCQMGVGCGLLAAVTAAAHSTAFAQNDSPRASRRETPPLTAHSSPPDRPPIAFLS